MKLKTMVLYSALAFLALSTPALTFGSDQDIVKLQGIVMEVDLKGKRMVVNERHFIWNEGTTLHNEKGTPVTFDNIKSRNWVYVEGTNERHKNRIVARKIYLLPKYIGNKERSSYPFIE